MSSSPPAIGDLLEAARATYMPDELDMYISMFKQGAGPDVFKLSDAVVAAFAPVTDLADERNVCILARHHYLNRPFHELSLAHKALAIELLTERDECFFTQNVPYGALLLPEEREAYLAAVRAGIARCLMDERRDGDGVALARLLGTSTQCDRVDVGVGKRALDAPLDPGERAFTVANGVLWKWEVGRVRYEIVAADLRRQLESVAVSAAASNAPVDVLRKIMEGVLE